MKFIKLSQKTKRRCVFVLAIYMVLSGLFLLVVKQNDLRKYITVSSLGTKAENGNHLLDSVSVKNRQTAVTTKTGDSLRQLEDVSSEVNQISDPSKPCFSPYAIPVEENLKEKLQKKNMLKYFKMNSNYKVSVPKWQRYLDKKQAINETKYYIASVLRVRLYASDKAKWTIKELKQWLHYQFWAGADHAYICIHYLNDSERFDPYLTEYVKHGLVTLIPWNNITSIPGSRTYQQDNPKNQVGCYNHVLKHYRNDAVWHYNFDVDENPYAPNDRCEGFLARYLRSIGTQVTGLRLANFILMGQGDRTRDIIYDRINRITPRPLNTNVKPIYKVAMTVQAGMHDARTKGQTVNPSHNELILLHYWGSRVQKWGEDTDDMRKQTKEFDDVRNTIAINIRHSLIAFGDFDAFATDTGP